MNEFIKILNVTGSGRKYMTWNSLVISAAVIYFWKYPNENAYMLLKGKWNVFFFFWYTMITTPDFCKLVARFVFDFWNW